MIYPANRVIDNSLRDSFRVVRARDRIRVRVMVRAATNTMLQREDAKGNNFDVFCAQGS